MKIIWTQYALNDLQDIREHLKVNQSATFVKKVTQEILAEVNSIQEWKTKGTFVPELEDLHLTTHRQLLAGQNRIIIERGHDDTVYVHMIAHTRRDLEALIRRRLLNS
ncbi:type II toxin-antitoxin system RelE/ParE family toxin [Rugamonas rubra]|uniref:Plasmid stabilization system protein ParE n=1 Tax=Rugamonas rubra TaxID=758825 RepID=A0A1I4I371_9BURK|nr:type II toxin-antitoxin system RelE/ParE family toxin [Rugamonas rubra]SFL48343.1 Plasmid stabilization system protein ParE [Rugamonas rubra]